MEFLPTATSQAVALSVLETFDGLHAKFKPQKNQWTVLAGIVIEHPDGHCECISLGTGVKCQPHEKVSLAGGTVLHDSHAEVLALRGLNVFLLNEASRPISPYLEFTPNSEQPFSFNPAYKLHLFTTTSPCGDASMNTLIASNPDNTPWTLPPPAEPADPDSPVDENTTPTLTVLRGRGYYSLLGSVRTKPGRADSPASWSKSCSDKISARMLLSALNTPTGAVISSEYVYLTGLVVPTKEFCEIGFSRAFDTRLAAIHEAKLPGGYAFHPLSFGKADVPIDFSREPGKKGAPVSAVWVQGVGGEALVNGVIQGKRAYSGQGASIVSKRSIWERAASVLDAVRPASRVLDGNYEKIKEDQKERIEAKKVLRGALSPWVRNGGNDIVLENA